MDTDAETASDQLTDGIVRVLSPDGTTAGTGFVVSPSGLVVTCIHVVQAGREASDAASISTSVQIEFVASSSVHQALIEPQFASASDDKDIAFLRVVGEMPPQVCALPLGSATSSASHGFRTFGFPPQGPAGGMLGTGVILGLLPASSHSGALQLQSAEIGKGFSGAPVWDSVLGCVTGMISDFINPAGAYGRLDRTAFAITTDQLYRMCTDLPLVDTVLRLGKELSRYRLPASISTFVGRQEEVHEISVILREPGNRLLTLTGVGGVGKTRLALEAGRSVENEFADGACFVELATIADGNQFATAVLDALGQAPSGEQQPDAILVDFLVTKHLLLIFDTFEHILSQTTTVARLIAACPRLTVLTTSQKPLQISGEREFSVKPLDVPRLSPPPTIEALRANDAVALFVRRAESVTSGFSLTDANALAVAEICVRLDGLPLAIELAAARIRMFPDPASLLTRLSPRLPMLTNKQRDAPPRHQTMSAALEWSFGLLSSSQRSMLLRLAVFEGGWTSDAIEFVYSEVGTNMSTHLADLEGLVESALVQVSPGLGSEPRFSMIELVREFGLERLKAQGKLGTVQEQHARYYDELARRLARRVIASGGSESPYRIQQLMIEDGNTRAALRWANATGNDRVLVSLVGHLWQYWLVRGNLTEGREWLDRALATKLDLPPDWRADLLAGAEILAGAQGQYVASDNLLARALEAAADSQLIPELQYNMAVNFYHSDDLDTTERLVQKSLEQFRAAGNKAGMAKCLNSLGSLYQDRGEYDKSATLLEECYELLESLGENTDRRTLGSCLTNWARLQHFQGKLDDAEEMLTKALEVKIQIGSPRELAFVEHMMATVVRDKGDRIRAKALFEDSIEHFTEAEDTSGIANASIDLGLMLISTNPARAHSVFKDSLAQLLVLGEQRGIARAAAHTSYICGRLQPERGARLIAGAVRIEQSLKLEPSLHERAFRSTILAGIQEKLGDEVFQRELELGRAQEIGSLVTEILVAIGDAVLAATRAGHDR